MNLTTLYRKTSTGAIQEWKIGVENNEDVGHGADIVTVYGQVSGKKQVAREHVSIGKNIGKANETTAYEQACAQAQSEWEGKKKKGYVEDIEVAQAGGIDTSVILGGISPMLAHKFSEQGHKITFPCYVQPKLDGHRCIAIIEDGLCTLWSRTRKQISGVPHIERELEVLFPHGTVVLDGELYNHDFKDRFDELTSFIRQTTPKSGHEVVQYWIYDTVLDHEAFRDRTEVLEARRSEIHDPIILVPTERVEDEDNLMFWFDQYILCGFEGAMARNEESLYINRRSYDLQKIKEFEDAEFEIVDVVPGVGKMSDKGIFVCKTESGDEFKVKMRGELEDLTIFLMNPDDYIGEMLTVKYQGLTKKNGVPRFGVGERIRVSV